MERLNGGAAVLVDHNTRDQVGVIENARIDADRVGRASLRFGRSIRAEEIYTDIKDGIRQLVSFGYLVHDLRFAGEIAGVETYRSDDWEPFEISIVSVPADPTVGVGRSQETEQTPPQITSQKRKFTMPESAEKPDLDIKKLEQEAVAKAQRGELDRIRTIDQLGAKFGKRAEAEAAIKANISAVEFQTKLLESLERSQTIVQAQTAEVGLSTKEIKRYSFLRALAAISSPQNRQLQEEAAFEFEVSAEAAKKRGKDTPGVIVPFDILSRNDFANISKRDLVAGTSTAGGHLVATDLLSGNFIELLRNTAVALSKATILDGLNGNIAIPKQTGSATGYWVAEGASPTESQQTLGQVTLTPKTLGAFTDYSRRLLLQSSIAVENFVRADLVRVIGLTADLAAINGSGSSNQPTGILNTSGIGNVIGGTNGLAPTWDHLVDLETEVAIDNALMGSLGYMINAKTRGKLKKTPVVSGYPDKLWSMNGGNSPLNGYGVDVSNQVPGNLTKGTSSGVCSAILFGDFSSLLVGMWSGIDLMVDPYTSSTSGTVRIVALQDMDIAVRYPESFAAMLDALTN